MLRTRERKACEGVGRDQRIGTTRSSVPPPASVPTHGCGDWRGFRYITISYSLVCSLNGFTAMSNLLYDENSGNNKVQ